MSDNWKVGDIVEMVSPTNRDFKGVLCKVTSINSLFFNVTIIKPSKEGVSVWIHGCSTGQFNNDEKYKFKLVESKTKEQRIFDKIKYLDNKWCKQQIKKGNNHALPLLR